MYLEKINLLNFKNYEEASFSFSPQINCFLGGNGSGKTNLLDAIYYLCISKSAFAANDAQSIRHGADFFLVDGFFHSDGLAANGAGGRPPEDKVFQITCALQKGQRKVILSDKKPYEKLVEHIGRFPVVLIAPNDTDLVREGSEERRRFFDTMLSQIDPLYLENLVQYNNLLKQRNSLLRLFADRRYSDEDMIETYDAPLIELAYQLYGQRREFIGIFQPVFQKHYTYLSESRESVDLVYESELADPNFRRDFTHSRVRDLQLQRTNKGAHKDDFIFEINGFSLKKFGSQGQQKSFVIALKLAQFEIIAHHKQFRPLLLLDDIFDKLDDRRIWKLTQMIADEIFGQLFVTDARPERTERFFSGLGTQRHSTWRHSVPANAQPNADQVKVFRMGPSE
ncbi:MAG: DNA replication and repair protein RecF [Ferruginibacter sp.]|nr:DNA replication and repair protein RecF [Cytophagales bacterium]